MHLWIGPRCVHIFKSGVESTGLEVWRTPALPLTISMTLAGSSLPGLSVLIGTEASRFDQFTNLRRGAQTEPADNFCLVCALVFYLNTLPTFKIGSVRVKTQVSRITWKQEDLIDLDFPSYRAMWARVGPWCPWASLCPPRGLTSFLGPSGWVPCHQSLHPSDLMRVFHRSPVRHTLKGLESTSLHYDSLQRPLWVGSAVPSGWVGHGTMRRGELVLCVAVPWLLGLVLLLLLLLVGRKFGDSLQDALFHSFSAPFDPPVKENMPLLRTTLTLRSRV